jgi:hypothetical protein
MIGFSLFSPPGRISAHIGQSRMAKADFIASRRCTAQPVTQRYNPAAGRGNLPDMDTRDRLLIADDDLVKPFSPRELVTRTIECRLAKADFAKYQIRPGRDAF